jgi:two-component system OmpR family sensor kinase
MNDPDRPTVYDIGLDGDVHYIVTEYRNPGEPAPTVETPAAKAPDVIAPTVPPKPETARPDRPKTLPLGVRVVGIFFLLLAATLLAVGAVTIRLTRNHLNNELEGRLSAAVSSFQTGPATRVTRAEDLAAEARTWLAAQALPPDEVVAVRTRAGEVLTSTGGLDLRRVEQSRALLTAGRSGWHTVDGPDGSVRALTVPLERNGQQAGTIVAAGERSPIESTLDALLSSVAWASGIGLVLATLLALAFLRRTLRPLARFSREVEAVEVSGDLTRRVEHDGPGDEVGQLAEAFNRMLASLEEAFRSQRRFVSDASHELRTPLTVARGQLELLAQELHSADARGSLAVAVDEIDRMGRIVDDLLLLARLDEGLPLKREPVEAELVLEEARLRAAVATRRPVLVHAERRLYARADHDRLLQVVTNLVTNAIEHTAADAEITLSSRRAAGRVVIEVHDTGPGIAPQDLEHVFERFYRGGTRDADVGSAGLGLAIAASLTRGMEGEIDVQSTPGAGTTFIVSLPSTAIA